MRQGQTLAELTSELEYQLEQREDLVVGTECLTMYPPESEAGHPIPQAGRWRLHIASGTPETLEMTDSALNQLTNITGPGYRDVLDIKQRGTDREKMTLAKYVTVRIQDRPITVKVRIVPTGFWEPKVIAAILNPTYEAKSGLSMLTQLLDLARLGNNIAFHSGGLDSDWMRATFIQPTNAKNGAQLRIGFSVQYSEAGHKNALVPVLVTQLGHIIVPGLGRNFRWTEINDEKILAVLDSAAQARKLYESVKGVNLKGVKIEEMFSTAHVNPSTARAIAKHMADVKGATLQGLIDHTAAHAEHSKTLSDKDSWELAMAAGGMLNWDASVLDMFRDKPVRTNRTPRGAKPTKAQVEASTFKQVGAETGRMSSAKSNTKVVEKAQSKGDSKAATPPPPNSAPKAKAELNNA